MDLGAFGGAILPVGGEMTTASLETSDPWRLLAEGTGLLVTWSPPDLNRGYERWGEKLRPASGIAQQLLAVTREAGNGKLNESSSVLFRLELPASSTLQDLIPAIGGGYRGLTKAAEGTTISGQVRLIPVSGVAAGAGIALGPLIGLMVLTIGAEMLGQSQQRKKLDEINQSVKRMEQHLQGELVAKLRSGEEALQKATAAILDRIMVPEGVPLGPAINGISDVKNLGLGWLERWERNLDALSTDGSARKFRDIRNALGVAVGGFDSFPAQVMTLYRALALDSRAQVVSAVEARLSHPGGTFEHFEAEIGQHLRTNSRSQDRLRGLLWAAAETRLTGKLGMANPRALNSISRTSEVLVRLAHATAELPEAPALLTPFNRLVLEILRRPDGSMELLQPRT